MPDQSNIEVVQEVIDELEGVAEERLRAKVKFEHEMGILEELGHTEIKGAQAALLDLDAKIQKREIALNEEFDDFISDYKEVFE